MAVRPYGSRPSCGLAVSLTRSCFRLQQALHTSGRLSRVVGVNEALMNRIDRWKLADELTVYQVALLIAGYDPSEFEADEPYRWPKEVTQDISPFLNGC